MPLRPGRIADQQRDVPGGLVDMLLAPHVVIAQHLAVIGGDDDQCLVVLACFLEKIHDPPEVVIHLRGQPQIEGAQQLDILVTALVQPRAAAHHRIAKRRRAPVRGDIGVHGLFLGRVGAAHRLGQGGRVIHAVVGLGGHQRRMGAQIGKQGEPVLLGAHRHLLQEGIGEKGGVAVLGAVEGRIVGPRRARGVGRDRRPDAGIIGQLIALLLQMRPPRIALVHGHLDDLVKARQHPFVGQQPRIARMAGARIMRGVGIAEQQRIIACLAHLQRHVGVMRSQRRTVAHRTVIHGVKPGEQAGARRPAGVGYRIVPLKTHRLVSKTANVGKIHMIGQRAVQAIGPQLVDDDEQNVSALHVKAPDMRQATRKTHKSTQM